jgi:hypothetical protein
VGLERRLSLIERQVGADLAPPDPTMPTLKHWQEPRLEGEPLADFPEFEAMAAERRAEAEATIIMFEGSESCD